MSNKVALITGVTGQDGAYLSRFLLKKGYEVHGIKRRSSSFNTGRVDNIYVDPHEKEPRFRMHFGDLTDASNLIRIIQKVRPDEIYNLGAQSHVKVSFETPEYTLNTDGAGTIRLLDIIKNLDKKIKFYQASTSEMYGANKSKVLNENSEFIPQSPYGASKLYAYWITKIYREAYDIFACNGILFNHESYRRGETFITKKITKAVVDIKLKKKQYLSLGNLSSIRDWGHARDYVEGMWKMMQHKKPLDLVLATNKIYSVRNFVEKSFSQVGIDVKWKGKGQNEIGINKSTNKVIVKVDKKYFRPLDVNYLRGDYSKAKKILNWEPKINLDKLIKEMITEELKNTDESKK